MQSIIDRTSRDNLQWKNLVIRVRPFAESMWIIDVVHLYPHDGVLSYRFWSWLGECYFSTRSCLGPNPVSNILTCSLWNNTNNMWLLFFPHWDEYGGLHIFSSYNHPFALPGFQLSYISHCQPLVGSLIDVTSSALT